MNAIAPGVFHTALNADMLDNTPRGQGFQNRPPSRSRQQVSLSRVGRICRDDEHLHRNVTTDAQGDASIQLPDWFEAVNTDFRYQLTVIGQFAQAIVSSRVSNHQFSIKTDKPNVDVSWQITAVRQDAFAKAHPLVVEVNKTDRERGFYLHPELYGAPAERRRLDPSSRNHAPRKGPAAA